MKYIFLGFVILFFLSRIFFINISPVFFDSPEYIDRISNTNLLQSLISGHMPLHMGYVFFYWIIYHTARLISLDSLYVVVFVQCIIFFLASLAFYKSIQVFLNKKSAQIAIALFCISPLFWISNETIMLESTVISVFSFLLYTWIRFLISDKCIWLILSVILFIVGLSVQLVFVFYIPFLLYLSYVLNNKKTIISGISVTLSFLFFTIIYGYVIAVFQNTTFQKTFYLLYIEKLSARSPFNFNIDGILVYARNFLIPLLRNNTNFVVLLSFLGSLKLLKKNTSRFVSILLLILPSVILHQWWDSVFFGRYGIISYLGIILFASYALHTHKRLSIISLLYVFSTVFPLLYYLRMPIPYIEQSQKLQQLPYNSIKLESHFVSPYIQGPKRLNYLFVGDPSYTVERIDQTITEALNNNKDVFITSQSLSEPYGLFTGPYLHTLGLSYKNNPILESFKKKYSFTFYKEINKKNNQSIYKVSFRNSSVLPSLPQLKYSSRRLDFYDPFSQVWFILSRIYLF